MNIDETATDNRSEKASDNRSVVLPRIALTPDEAAASTGFARTRIFRAIKGHELTARKDGKATVIETVELVRWVRSLPHRGRNPEAESAAA